MHDLVTLDNNLVTLDNNLVTLDNDLVTLDNEQKKKVLGGKLDHAKLVYNDCDVLQCVWKYTLCQIAMLFTVFWDPVQKIML